nr:SNF2-related protein [uncultured Rhodoferax sp.]
MTPTPTLDDAAGASPITAIERMKLNAELMGLVRKKKDIAPSSPMGMLANTRIASQIVDVLRRLGMIHPKPPTVTPEVDNQPRNPSAKFYEFDPNRKHAQRKRDNAEAMALLVKIDSGEVDGFTLTDEQKGVLAKYSGTGGALVGADGKKGSAYEYYTPKPIAEGMWSLLRELGFAGGKVSDPCGGVGIFGGTAPIDAVVDVVELNETSGRINALVNQGPGYSVEISAYEKVATATPDEMYDAVITNVPFGALADRGGNELGDKRYQKEPLQNYFILRSLEKLRPGGLAAFITPPRCVSGKGGKEEELRTSASFMAEFVGAYRLPNMVFGTANADTITDVIVFRKFSREVTLKIEELREQDPARLIEANVLWPEFIGGRYFTGEGKRFVLGELIPKDPNKYRDVDRVVTNGSVTDIAKLLRKFPESRVNWELLAETETQPIIYAEGDTVTQKGQTLQFKDGTWVVVESNEASPDMLVMGGKMGTPLQAFQNGVTFSQAVNYVQFMIDTSQALDIPDWARGAFDQLKRMSDEGGRNRYWNAGLVGMSVEYLLSKYQAEEVGFNYLEEFPELSKAMKRVAIDAKNCPGVVGGAVKSGMKALGVHYSKKHGYSGVWSGSVQADQADARTEDQKFEGVKYSGQGLWVDRADAEDIYGANFDPVADSDWCLSDDGKQLAKADDYFVGNYGDMMARLDAAASAATDPEVRGKLLAQRMEAEKRVDRVDVSTVSFNLFSPYSTMEEKAEFMRRFVSPHFAVAYDEETGKPYVECTLKKIVSSRDKLLKRMAQYLKNGTVTLGGAQVGDDKEAMTALRGMINTANEQFNGWCKANPLIMARLHEVANDPARLYFKQVDDESPLVVPGLTGNVTPHGYQNSFIRRMGRNFGGINGDGVGLGKTMQGLVSVAHVQAIGVKKKTGFIVPNSVLSNWRKEAKNIYASLDDCLFVGLDVNEKTGKSKVDPANYDRDLNIVLENRHKKIFMTMEAFQRLRLRDETVAGYEAFMRSVDASFAESEDKKSDEAAKGKAKRLVALLTDGKSGATPYLEDMGIDSIVSDESHAYKNSAATVEFKSAKFLALAPSAARGIDMQAKAWYIRTKSPLKDGVLLLTATPITNSPLEVYSMLSLAVGRDRVNDMAMGIKGADQFMDVMCRVESEEDETVDGIVRDTRIFKGLENVAVLRNALGDVATIRTAETVGQQVKVPDADMVSSPVALPDPPILETLMQYKGAFRYAIDMISERKDNRGDQAAYEAVAAKFGEPMELIGHPFNLINKMTMLIIDPELDERATFYQVSKAQADKAAAVITTFNARKFTEERARPGPHSGADAVVGQITRKDGEDKTVFLKIQVAAKLDGDRIIIDTITPETQSAFETIADKEGLDLDVTVPPKLAALIANITKEESTPRGVDSEGNHTPRVKQLIFCDILPLHNKIKLLLTKRAGIPASAIAIITGKQNNTPDEIMAVQDGFNADGADNKYRVVIANEKAEVGINLQRGTQAIHHLTIGWTPDSLTQRNGRGVRQGNKTERVTVYTYDADGTFDSHKRAMVSKKSGWIDQVMDVNGGDSINVEGGMSREQLEALIDTVGDADAMTRLQERLANKEREVRAVGVRAKQTVNIRTVQASRKFMEENPDAKSWAARKFGQYYALKLQVGDVQSRLRNPKASANALVKGQNLLADLQARLSSLKVALNEALTITKSDSAITATIDEFLADITSSHLSRGESMADKVISSVAKGTWKFKVYANENSSIANEWQSEIDMTKAMIKVSKSTFTKQSKEDGGMPKEVMDAFSEGRGVIFDGKPVVDGAFIKNNSGNLGVIKDSGLVIQAWDAEGRANAMRLGSLRPPYSIILPGSAEYDAAVTEAAQIDDAIATAGIAVSDANALVMFSTLVPAVSQRRTTTTLMLCDVSDTGLPAPYFPRVLDPELSSTGPVFAAIIASQSAVVKAYKSDRYGADTFTVESTVPVMAISRNRSTGFLPEAVAFARSHGMKITMAEIYKLDVLETSIRGLVGRKDVAAFESILTGSNEDELNAAANAWVAAVLPDVDLGDVGPVEMLTFGEKYALQAAIKRVMTPPQVPVAEAMAQGAVNPVPSVGPVQSGPIGDNDMVGVKGNTMTWKNWIKMAATEVGSRAIWDGKAECWNVPYKAWVALTSKNPRCLEAGQLEMVEFSGKAAYGKRR